MRLPSDRHARLRESPRSGSDNPRRVPPRSPHALALRWFVRALLRLQRLAALSARRRNRSIARRQCVSSDARSPPLAAAGLLDRGSALRRKCMFINSFLPIVIGLAATLQTRTFTFENDRVGAPPAEFEFARTGNGPEGKWTVEPERGNEKNHVLLQSSADKTDYRFPVAVLKDESLRDVTLRVRARPLAGEVDQGFGLVWRYRDANNYYITRCNADEDNCTIYHTIKGSRRAFQDHPVKVATNVWHTLKMEARGNHFIVWLDR